ncbi:hypothetical protein D9V37_10500 [Nocardioides mangrovicus]|uniref:Uncharacterized protein n=1 Tax=Nocardioides mangrovicus TaxID=2478913 RepID=A0A3L8P0M7_9ACTN|nr:hypothetical protein [Nocardioides mangrovicus]RLV49005.1 hypothetical protein D9V37_10500 [Nocardioides mangrovicus]
MNRAQVEQLAQQRREQAEVKAQREPRLTGPPDDEHYWLTVPQAAEVAGVTRQAMHVRLKRDRLPYEISDGRR